MPNPVANQAITVGPAAYAKLQVLLPNQTSDPGKFFTNNTGRVGSPNSVAAGTFVTATGNAVDAFFNLINFSGNILSFTTRDGTSQGAPATLAFRTATH